MKCIDVHCYYGKFGFPILDMSMQNILDQAEQAEVEKLRSVGVLSYGLFVLGLPGETRSSLDETLDFALELDCDIASFNIAVPVLGTPLREVSLAKGYLKDGGMVFDSSDAYPVLETPQFSKEQAWKWRKRAIKEFYFRPGYLWRLATQARSLYQWKLLLLNGFALLRRLAPGRRG